MTEIFHYGIKGMRWGIRRERGPDGRVVDGGSRVIRKGKRVQNISANVPRELRDKTPLYASFTPQDNALYAGWYAFTKKHWEDLEPYKNDLVVRKDVRVASEQVAAQKFIEIYKADPPGVAKAIASTITDRSTMAKIGKEMGVPVEKLSEKVLIARGEKFMTSEKGTKLFNSSLVSDHHADLRKRYFEALMKEGYGALIDINDKTNGYGAQDPLIFLDPKRQLKTAAATKLTEKDIDAALDKYALLTGVKS